MEKMLAGVVIGIVVAVYVAGAVWTCKATQSVLLASVWPLAIIFGGAE